MTGRVGVAFGFLLLLLSDIWFVMFCGVCLHVNDSPHASRHDPTSLALGPSGSMTVAATRPSASTLQQRLLALRTLGVLLQVGTCMYISCVRVCL